jgi:hypothetical protein
MKLIDSKDGWELVEQQVLPNKISAMLSKVVRHYAFKFFMGALAAANLIIMSLRSTSASPSLIQFIGNASNFFIVPYSKSRDAKMIFCLTGPMQWFVCISRVSLQMSSK